MADIELVIKIPKYMFKDIQDRNKHPNKGNGINLLEHAVANGIPLPKGHGDLKDMDDIYEALEGWDDDTGWIVDAIDFQAPTIIEADTAESEEV